MASASPQHRLHALKQTRPDIGQFDLAVMPAQQLDSPLQLECLDSMGNRRLGYLQVCGRERKTTTLRDGYKNFQLGQRHCLTMSNHSFPYDHECA